MAGVIRRTKARQDDIHDEAILSKHISDDVVTGAKVAESPQSGSTVTSLTAAYTSYGVTFGMTPTVTIEKKDAGIDYLYKDSVAAGSFSAIGSPADLYFEWWAQGLT